MTAQDKSLGNLLHDVKSLITSIHAYNQLLQRRLKNVKDQSTLKYSHEMDKQIKKLIDLVQNFTLEKNQK